MLPDAVLRKLEALPASPGVYVFLDRKGTTLYVGKARSLRQRVRSYFQAGRSDGRPFIDRLPIELGDLETFVAQNEKEAALLENALIKERRPRYNVKLRDDKEFLSIRLDPREPWPRLTMVRKPRQDGARYFGPYDSATAARKTLRLVNRHFRLRTCRDADFANRVRPCLQHQIKRCPAPCVLEVDHASYLEQAALVGLFLEGRHDELTEGLRERMAAAAQSHAFEQAAVLRDQLRAIEKVHVDQRVAVASDVDQDVVGLHVERDRAEVAMLLIRGGRMTNVRTFSVPAQLPDDELVSAFLVAYYASGAVTPDEVLLPLEIEAMDGLASALEERRGRKVAVLVPQRGAKRDLVRMAVENAEHAFAEKQRDAHDTAARLAEVAAKLRLARPPARIECVDISHLGGGDTVAAFTVLTDGELDRSAYRTFHVREVAGGDDFGAMREVLERRLRRSAEAGWAPPDLLVVDGGRGQLGVALRVAEMLAKDPALEPMLAKMALVGLAKEKTQASGKHVVERVFLPGQKNPILLRERSPTRQLLTLVRDEAHRVSNAMREKLGTRRRLTSALDGIPGIGRATRVRLVKAFGAASEVFAASDDALRGAGLTSAQLGALRDAMPRVDVESVLESVRDLGDAEAALEHDAGDE